VERLIEIQIFLSAMFTDSWTEADIELKISQAWENGIKKVSDPLDPRKTAWRGFTDDGIPLQFSVENAPPSVYANFDISSWK